MMIDEGTKSHHTEDEMNANWHTNKDADMPEDTNGMGSDVESEEGTEDSDETLTKEQLGGDTDSQLAVMTDKYLRLSAEFDNYRKRTLKEKADMLKSAGEDVLIKILPVVDNFERALDSLEKSNDVDAIRKGVELIYSSFKDFLAQNGVKEIDCQHKDFNTDEHEAVTKIPAPSEDLKGKVVDCIQKGYILNGKVIRFPKVVVGE